MKKLPTVLIGSLALAISLFGPTKALAGHHQSHHATVVIVGSTFVSPVIPRPFFAQPFVGPVVVRRIVPFAVVTSPVVVYSPPPVVYAPPPVVYAPPPAAYYVPPAVAPEPPPMPRVIQYPHGRYELRGDGIMTPYVWVWIPNPPQPPPPPAAPSPEPPAQQTPPASQSGFYCWTDEQGVTTWTDRLGKVPERYRAQAQRVL